MQLIIMGTGPFGIPTFRALLDSKHRIAALVTQPARSVRAKKAEHGSPMRELAEEMKIPVLAYESVNTDPAREELSGFNADLFFVCDFGQILSRETLAVSRLGGINLHASLLPKYRGAAPINWAIYHGETETGVTVIHMTPGVDAGPCLAREATPIGPRETAPELEARLAKMGSTWVCRSIDALEAGNAQPIQQDSKLVTKAPRLKKSDGLVDWSRTAPEIVNQVRAFKPWPATYSFWHRDKDEPLRIILEEVEAEASSEQAPPGSVTEASGERLTISTGQGALAIGQLQPAGKRVMSAAEFLRGNPIRPGDKWDGSIRNF